MVLTQDDRGVACSGRALVSESTLIVQIWVQEERLKLVGFTVYGVVSGLQDLE